MENVLSLFNDWKKKYFSNNWILWFLSLFYRVRIWQFPRICNSTWSFVPQTFKKTPVINCALVVLSEKMNFAFLKIRYGRLCSYVTRLLTSLIAIISQDIPDASLRLNDVKILDMSVGETSNQWLCFNILKFENSYFPILILTAKQFPILYLSGQHCVITHSI